MNKEKLIIFDCDGTLVDSEVVATDFFTSFWADYNVVYTPDEFKKIFIGTGADSSVVREHFSKFPEGVRQLGDKLYKEELVKSLLPVPGIEDVIKSLNYPMCVASNSTLEHVNVSLEKTNLKKYFENKLFSAHQVQQSKPAPDLFLYAARELGFKPENCLVIEDSLAGIQAAQNASMKVIAFSGASHFIPELRQRLIDAKADFYCESSIELMKTINEF